MGLEDTELYASIADRRVMDAPVNRDEQHFSTLPVLLLALLAVLLGSIATIRLLEDSYSPPVWMLVEYSVTLLLPAILMYGAYWLASGEFTSDELWSTLWWTVGGIIVLTVVAGFVLLHGQVEGMGMAEPIFLVALLSLIGGVAGFATAVTQLHRTRVIEPMLEHSDDQAQSEDDGVATHHPENIDGPEILRSRAQERSLMRQWAALEAIATCGDCSLDELATMLAQDPRNTFTSDPERVKLRLYHYYLPSIAETGLIDFNRQTKFVQYTGPVTLTP